MIISDVDIGTVIGSVTVKLTDPRDGNSEILSLTDSLTGGIVVDVASGTKLTLTNPNSTATVTDFEKAIESIHYDNTSSNPTPGARTITVVANDGEADSNTATTTVTVAATSDTFIGGAGNDELNGNPEADDLFIFRPGSDQDTVTGFSANDLIDLRAFGFTDFGSVSIDELPTPDGFNTVIDLGNNDLITLLGVAAADVQLDQFLL